MEQIRSFIAIELPSHVKAELASLEKKLKEGRHHFVKWVDPEGIHLTLKFLGNIASTAVPQIVEVITGAAKPFFPLHLQLGDLGAFPNMKRPQVVWVGVEGEVENLCALQKGVDSALSQLGFVPESRSFSPHLTLGRLRDRITLGERQDFAHWISSVGVEMDLFFEISDIKLMKSQLTPRGAVYTQLASIELSCGG